MAKRLNKKGVTIVSHQVIKWAIAILVGVIIFFFYEGVYDMLVGALQWLADKIKLGW